MKNKRLSEIYTRAFHAHWEELAFTDFDGGDYKYKDIAKTIKSLHLFYQLVGIQRGDKIAIFGRNSAHWAAAFLSAVSAGLTVVPMMPDFDPENTNHIINHSESKIVFGANALLEKVDVKKSPNLQVVLGLEDFSLHWGKDENLQYKLADGFSYYEENELTKKGFVFEEWEEDEMCMISYTSGTSGTTKGVMLPERSVVSNIVFAQEHMPLQPGDKIVSFLPMAHTYGLTFEFLFPVTLGCHITFLNKMPSPTILTKVFADVKPNLILSVPLVIEKIYKKRLLPTLEKPLIKILLKIPGISGILLKKIRQKLVDTFGGRFFEIVVGAAPLSADVEKFFKRIKFPFTIGYGMTECGPLISYEAWNKTMPLSAGRVVDRMEVRIDSEDPFNVVGEIQVRGENVMLGYYKNEKDTKAAFTKDGWLKTGDLGVIDKNNFIYIRGRSKNMILGPSGQNIYPEEIEAKLSNQPYVAECVVVEREKRLIGLVFPDEESMKQDGVKHDDLQELMEINRKKINKELPAYEQVARIELVKEEFEKTPKRNIKRYKYV